MSEEAEVPSTSPDPVSDNIEKLKGLFPEAVTEDGIDADVLLQLLGEDVAEGDEKYGLNWHGKKRARQLALTPSAGTLRPCPEDSVDWDSTQNLMIEGDNLEVLKLLQKSYAGKVKLIYIDPPYNTGKDFVYPDNFKDSIGNYLSLTGQVDEEGNKMSSNTESSGRFHTDWLNMMYPRLKVARELLREDGFLFVSVDSGELHNLRAAGDEIFGSENFVELIVLKNKAGAGAKPKGFISVHEYILCYAMDINRLDGLSLPMTEEQKRLYNKKDQNYAVRGPYGTWALATTSMEDRPNLRFAIEHEGETILPDKQWLWSSERVAEAQANGELVFNKKRDGKWSVRFKRYLNDSSGGENSATPTSLWDGPYTHQGSADQKQLFGSKPFSFPKPVALVEKVISIGCDDGDLILDFFAGSGTTGHAVMAQNAADGGSRRYILVQLPEPLDPSNKDQKVAAEYCDDLGKARTIAELSKERLRRSAKKVKVDYSDFEGDLGFRVFKLDSSNIRSWDPQLENLDQKIKDSVITLKDDRDEQDVLYEVLLKLGLDLCVPIETKEIAGAEIHSIGAGTLFACLAEELDAEAVEALAQGIISWRDEIDPAGETTCLFRDSAFSGNVAKTNLNAILEQGGIETVRCI